MRTYKVINSHLEPGAVCWPVVKIEIVEAKSAYELAGKLRVLPMGSYRPPKGGWVTVAAKTWLYGHYYVHPLRIREIRDRREGEVIGSWNY